MSTTRAILRDIFVDLFALPSHEDAEEAAYGQVVGWDSLGHMALVRAVEDRFGVLLDADEIVDMADFETACALVVKHGAV